MNHYRDRLGLSVLCGLPSMGGVNLSGMGDLSDLGKITCHSFETRFFIDMIM